MVASMLIWRASSESLGVAHCQPSRPSAVTFDKLVMPSERKEMIKALVHRFAASDPTKDSFKPWAADFVESKGEGKIFLLHGGPGVGKTYVSSEPQWNSSRGYYF